MKFSYPYSNKLFSRRAYKKALLVIDSCETESHLEGAKKYIHNYLMAYSTYERKNKFETDQFILYSFDRLKEKFIQKKSDLGW